jgi:hypothetical protein
VATYPGDQWQHILGISSQTSGGSEATYLRDQWQHIWFNVEIRLTHPKVEAKLGLSLAKQKKGTKVKTKIQ